MDLADSCAPIAAGTPVLWEALCSVPDHRTPAGRRYPLAALLTIALAAMLCGRKSQAGIARWAQALSRSELRLLGVRERRAPCRSTWCVVFQGLNVEALEAALGAWLSSGTTALGHIAVDGKRLRGSREGERRGVHLLAAYSTHLQGVIDTVAVPAEGNEAGALLTLLKRLPLKGTIITGDAAFTQRPIAQAIIDGGGDYLLTVKHNQEMLWRDIHAAFGPPSPLSSLPPTPPSGSEPSDHG